MIDCHQPKEDTDSGAQQHRIGRVHTQHHPDRYDRSARERRKRVKIAPQNKWDVSGEDITGHPAAVEALAVKPDGKQLATAAGQSVRVWDLATGTAIQDLPGHSAGVVSASMP